MWEFTTGVGTWRIVPSNGGWQAMWEDERLGWYHSPEAALDDLCGGHTNLPSSGVDSSECGLPDELSEWVRRPIR